MGWIESEFETINLGDCRLNRRAINILECLGLSPGRTIPQAFQAWGEIKACYNFCNNDLVSEDKIFDPHIEKTIERIKECPVVLMPSDTTDLDYTTKLAMADKERLGNKRKGLWLHSTTAVTPERLTLGIIDANFWSRQDETAEDTATYRSARDKAPIEEKESYRWLQSYKRACEIAREAPGTQIINITDREGDIIEIFEEASIQKRQGIAADYIIRSQYDRRIETKNNEQDTELQNEHEKLWEKLKNSTSLGGIEFVVPSTKERRARKVKQKLKAVRVTLTPAGKPPVEVNAVMAIESSPPQGEKPLVWVLITSLQVDTFEDVCKIIQYYLCRWEIETFFKVLKSGCKIEERQLQNTERMKNLIALFMILSWRVMYTMMLGRVCAEMSCGDIFDAAEWKAVCKIVNRKKPLPRKPPPLGEFIVLVATLGGYVVTKNGEPPGVKTMWKGMARMIDFSIAWEAFRG